MDNKYIYIYDGTFEGFLCCVYTFYKEKDKVVDIKTDDEQLGFFTSFKEIDSNKENFNKVYDAIQNKISFESLNIIYYAFLSEEKGRELKILDYIMLGFKVGSKVENMLAIPSVLDVIQLSRKTSRERHRFLGLVRFKKVNNMLCSFIEPTCNILPLLSNHFVDRFVNENFIIYDLQREYMLIYNDKKTIFLSIEKENMQNYINYPDNFEIFWKTYHKTMGIESRKNERCQKNNMPVKYWKHLIEME